MFLRNKARHRAELARTCVNDTLPMVGWLIHRREADAVV